jgi:putative pyruvate formate lyase activating enzyme
MPQTARRYSNAPDYPAVAEAAIAEMVRQTGAPVLDGEGIMRSGTVVRLLLLPKHLIEAKMILRKLYLSYGERIYISLMSQYTPVASASERFKHLSERVSAADYASLVEYAVSLGITQAFTQEGEAASERFIPHFGIED